MMYVQCVVRAEDDQFFYSVKKVRSLYVEWGGWLYVWFIDSNLTRTIARQHCNRSHSCLGLWSLIRCAGAAIDAGCLRAPVQERRRFPPCLSRL